MLNEHLIPLLHHPNLPFSTSTINTPGTVSVNPKLKFFEPPLLFKRKKQESATTNLACLFDIDVYRPRIDREPLLANICRDSCLSKIHPTCIPPGPRFYFRVSKRIP